MPDRFVVLGRFGHPFTVENVVMHADDEHFLIIGSVKNADAPAFGQITRRAPEKIVFQFGGAGMFVS